jgi:hypothetical protein
MADLTSSLYNGKNSRYVDVFQGREIGLGLGWGYSAREKEYDGASLSITFELGDAEKEDSKARGYRLRLPFVQVRQVLDYILNPNYTMSFFGHGVPAHNRDRHFKELLADIGIQTYLYRYYAPRGGRDYVYVDAVNKEHAEWQFKKLIKEFDESKLELVKEAPEAEVVDTEAE